MTLKARVVNFVIKYFFRTLLKIDDDALAAIPAKGPYILAANHINAIEVPVMVTHLLPRPVTGLAKVESWSNPFFNFLFNLWDMIPIERGTADFSAFNQALQALKQNKIVVIAPEGTRSKDGKLLQGKPGVVPLAVKGGVPIYPLAFFGTEIFWHNIKRLRRTAFHIRVGRPFKVVTGGAALDRDTRQEITDNIMYRIAELLPPEYRGYYADLSKATGRFLIDQ
jgi:1-acyl-sn-glycerol-3-phosphate acyltransferase